MAINLLVIHSCAVQSEQTVTVAATDYTLLQLTTDR